MSSSALACHSCRRRKVKCDRTFPQCRVCDQTSQACNYPLRPMRPGPKIGSLQKQRRLRQVNERSHSRRPGYSSHPSHGTSLGRQQDMTTRWDDAVEEAAPVSEEATQTVSRNEVQEEESQRNSQRNILDLAFVLHPSHQVTATDKPQEQRQNSQNAQVGLSRQACNVLGVSQDTMNQIIEIFFDNMVAINIFHKPTFARKLSNITSSSQLTALLAAIAGYASRFAEPKNGRAGDTAGPAGSQDHQPTYFIDLAFKHIDMSLADYDDEVPPLCVIQALIIATHCRLTQGVRGKAWRSLGLCVSLMYESNLHCMDSRRAIKVKDVLQWQEDEEKRRAFWAIWEMDVFASTIRRTPTGIDWNHLEVLLPVDNTHWFSGKPTRSCFMEADPNQRWRSLQDSGNVSPKAWFLVINSLMKEAQLVRDIQAASATDNDLYLRKPNYHPPSPASAIEGFTELETFANAVRCFTLALPSDLQYRDQYLTFGAPTEGLADSPRQHHCSIYNIYVMTQLAYLMIYRNEAFSCHNNRTGTSTSHRAGEQAGRQAQRSPGTEDGARRQYYEAADRILRIVNQSCVEHIQYINPFLPSTIWLAAAVQLVRKYFTRERSNQSLIRSRFDVLHMTYKRCMDFWDIQTALQRNLELIGEQLEVRHNKGEGRPGLPTQEVSKRPKKGTGLINQTSTDRGRLHTEEDIRAGQTLRQTTQYLPETPSVLLPSSAIMDSEIEMVAQNSAPQSLGSEQIDMFDPLAPLQPSGNHTSEDSVGATNSNFVDPIYQLDQPFDWPTFDFPGGLHGLMVGMNPY